MNPYQKGSQAYKKAAVNTTDQGTLILMLYDGAIRFIKASLIQLEQQNLEGAHNSLLRSKDIVAELIASLNLDSGGDIGANLKTLYSYIYNRLIDANINKDMVLAQESLHLLNELRDGWKSMLIKDKAAGSSVIPSRGGSKTIQVEG